jgi:3-oxoadipate enol-lactonase
MIDNLQPESREKQNLMADVLVDGCRIRYWVDGPEQAPALLLSNSIGSTAGLWDQQVERFSASFRVIRYDTRGHGRSDTRPGEYALDQLGRDALAVLDGVGVWRAHFCGISLGGITGLWLGVHAPERIGRLIAANTAARIGTTTLWTERMRTVRSEGMRAIADATMVRWFSLSFRDRNPTIVERFRSMLAGAPAPGYAGCCAALRDADVRGDLGRIRAQTLVIAGAHDVVTSVEDAAFISDRVANARLVTLDAAHLSNVEQPDAFNSAVLDFLAEGNPR